MPTLNELYKWLKDNSLPEDSRIFAGANNDSTADLCVDCGDGRGIIDFPEVPTNASS
jgi:hypothetical protein